jgi:hypothetical protein
MFTEIYLRTTDPNDSLYNMLKHNTSGILLSVIFHTIIYWGFVQLVSFIFIGKWLSNSISIRLIIILLLIMFFGYIGRYYHVKDIYKAYGYDKIKTREHVDKLYIGWIFIA